MGLGRVQGSWMLDRFTIGVYRSNSDKNAQKYNVYLWLNAEHAKLSFSFTPDFRVTDFPWSLFSLMVLSCLYYGAVSHFP